MSILINSVSVNDKNVGNPPSKNVVKKDPKADISQSLFDNKIVASSRQSLILGTRYPGGHGSYMDLAYSSVSVRHPQRCFVSF